MQRLLTFFSFCSALMLANGLVAQEEVVYVRLDDSSTFVPDTCFSIKPFSRAGIASNELDLGTK